MNVLQSTFSRCHSYLCRRTLTFSSSLRSVGNEAAGIPFWSKTQPFSVPPSLCMFYAFVRYRTTLVRQRPIISLQQQTIVSSCESRDNERCITAGEEVWTGPWGIFCRSDVFLMKVEQKLHQHEPHKHIMRDACVCYSLSRLIFFETSINEDHLFGEAMTLKTRRQRTMPATWAVCGSSRWRLWTV